MLSVSREYAQLLRFPLVFTLWSDFLAGYFIALAAVPQERPDSLHVIVMLVVATFLGTGGMTLMDCLTWESEKEHGRERPLPAGLLSAHAGFAFGLILMLVAIACATLVSALAGLMAVLSALLWVIYGSLTSGLPLVGSVNLALIRALNVIVGMAFALPQGPLVPASELWGPVAALFGYVMLITQIASETTRLNRERLLRVIGATVVVLVVFNALLYFPRISHCGLDVCLLMSVFIGAVIARLLQLARRVARELTPESVEKLVIGGFVGVIVLNANFIAFTGNAGETLGTLFLLLPTFLMLRFFHVLFPGTKSAMD